MATKEDILEQIVEEYLSHKGYFVQHNVKFLPRKDHPDFVQNKDSNHSDIDVIGVNPKIDGPNRVVAVSCKSWQSGFNPVSEIAAIEGNKVRRGRHAWQAFRELTVPKWSEAFVDAVRDATGTDQFTYILAVAKVVGEKTAWEEYRPFSEALGGNPIRILTFREMVMDIQSSLTTTLAATEVGRMLQMFQAAGVSLAPHVAVNDDPSQNRTSDCRGPRSTKDVLLQKRVESSSDGSCACGCGEDTKGGRFRPGHDQRLRSAIEDAAGGIESLRSLVEAHLGKPLGGGSSSTRTGKCTLAGSS